jgi:membrane-associated phospholipid phosphatase
MTRVVVARVVSIVGHPVVFVLVAALIAASTRGASLQQLQLVGGALVALGVIVLGFSWLQVRAGRWSHVDASVRNERSSLNVFLGALCLLSAVLLWLLTRRPHMSIALALSGALFVMALTIARWVKVSLHAAFAAFATALLWPNKVAVVVGVLVTAAVVWSRLVLGRHVAGDVTAGLLLGAAAGGGYHLWVV